MLLSFKEFIKSESGICMLLGLGCIIFAVLLIFLIIREKKKEQSSYTKLNLEEEMKASNVDKKEIKVKEEKPVVKQEKVENKPVKKQAATKKEETVKAENTTKQEVIKEEKDIVEKKEPVKVEEPKKQRVTNYHVSKHSNGGWQVKREGSTKALKLFNTQAEAIAFAKEKAENQENNIVIHKKSGQIRKQDYSKK